VKWDTWGKRGSSIRQTAGEVRRIKRLGETDSTGINREKAIKLVPTQKTTAIRMREVDGREFHYFGDG